jgi:hypothetical protein
MRSRAGEVLSFTGLAYRKKCVQTAKLGDKQSRLTKDKNCALLRFDKSNGLTNSATTTILGNHRFGIQRRAILAGQKTCASRERKVFEHCKVFRARRGVLSADGFAL